MKTRLLAAAAASLLFSLAVMAFSWSLADLASVRARLSMADWEVQQHAGPVEEWQTAYDRLRLAHRLNPLSADYSADLGRLLEWRAWQHPPGSRGYDRYRDRASSLYLETVAKRPSWGFGWAHLAENQLLRGIEGSSYRTALEKAIALAPWEPAVQRKVAWMGMASWPSLPESTRASVRENVQRALDLTVYADEIVRLSLQYHWGEELAPMLRTPRQVEIFNFVHRQVQAR
jgi:hypothetical protein